MKYLIVLLMPFLLWGKGLSEVFPDAKLVGRIAVAKDYPISQATFLKFSLSLSEFREKRVDYVLLDLDTPGGEVYATMRIARLLREFDEESGIPVVCYIDNWAVSAGAMIAYACRYIVVNPRSIMGAAEPVHQGGEGQIVSSSEKINSALRAEFASVAGYFGRNPLIAKAMVDKDLVLVKRGKGVVELGSDREIQSGDDVITREGKLLTLNSGELLSLDVANFQVDRPLLAKDVKVLEYKSWKITFFSLLTHPMVASLLFMGMMIGFYLEITTPGFGIPGIVGLVCLGLILLSSFSVFAVGWLEVIFMLLGVLLLLIEMFVIPGFGFTGIVGIALLVVGLFLLMTPLIEAGDVVRPDIAPIAWQAVWERMVWFSGSLVLALVIMIILGRVFRRTLFFRSKLVLKGEEEGFDVRIDPKGMPKIGDEGVATSPLRPSGKIEVCGKLFDGVTDGEFVESGESIQVTGIEANKVIVKKC